MSMCVPNGVTSLYAVTCLQAVPGLTGEAAAASTLVSLQQAADPGAAAEGQSVRDIWASPPPHDTAPQV